MVDPKSPFKWRHFQSDIILLNVRWYCRYALSYRDLEEMMAERGVENVKRIVKPMMGFQSFNTARRTLRGIEAMNMICKGQVKEISKGDSLSQVEFIHEIFGVRA